MSGAGGRVRAGTAHLLLDVEARPATSPAERVGLVVPLTEAGCSLRLQTYCSETTATFLYSIGQKILYIHQHQSKLISIAREASKTNK